MFLSHHSLFHNYISKLANRCWDFMRLGLQSLHKNITIYAQTRISPHLLYGGGVEKQGSLKRKYFMPCKIKGVGFRNKNEVNFFLISSVSDI